jgi:transposase-like protein
MSKKRKQYSAQLKAKVALEAIRGEKTVAEIAAQYEIHPTMVHNWKRQLQEGASDLFDQQNQQADLDSDAEAQIAELYRQIGQLKVERDFLANRSARLGLPTEKPW